MFQNDWAQFMFHLSFQPCILHTHRPVTSATVVLSDLAQVSQSLPCREVGGERVYQSTGMVTPRPVILVLRRPRQGDYEFKASLGYIGNSRPS